jgi:hypothetical protein
MSFSSMVDIYRAQNGNQKNKTSVLREVMVHNIAGGFCSAGMVPFFTTCDRCSCGDSGAISPDLLEANSWHEGFDVAQRIGVAVPGRTQPDFQNEDEMTQADIHLIIVRIFANAADYGRAITPPQWEELEPATDGRST